MPVDRAQQPDPPCPTLTISVDVSADAAANETALLGLPAKPGVLVIEDEAGGTVSLLQTADLRRAARVRLGPVDPEQSRSRRADLRPIARRVRAVTVGSTFEADWATLQLARLRLPHSYRSMLDRWQAWFVRCDPHDEFPEWSKTAHPAADSAAYAGPFADKHAAARFREMLEDAFDLCRFHHILVQAPHGSACAYKEMGRCPAPCDGTVSMQHYYQQIHASIAFAQQPTKMRQALELKMRELGAAMDYEGANRFKSTLERSAISGRSEFAQVRDFAAFRFLAVLPAERRDAARIFAIIGGWICPIIDIVDHKDTATTSDAISCAAQLAPRTPEHSTTEMENIGMVCRHLLLPKAQAKRRRAEFLHWSDQQPDTVAMARAIKRVLREDPPDGPMSEPPNTPEPELEINA